MEVTTVGAVFAALAAAVGLAGLRHGALPAAALLGAALPMQATAFATFGWAGGTNILLATMTAAVFVAAACAGAFAEAVRRGAAAPGSLATPHGASLAAILLLAFVAVSVVGAWALPRIFAGQTLVFPLDRTAEGVTGGALKLPLVRLAPNAGALTQSLYLMSSAAVFLAMIWAARRDRRAAPAALWAASGAQIVFAALDAAGWSGLALVRTATYQIVPEQALAGFTRLVGASTEPSQFGLLSAALTAWHLWRWRGGGPRHIAAAHGVAAVGLAGLALGSLSTTAIAALVFALAWFAAGGVARPRGPGAVALLAFGAAALTGLAGWAAFGSAAAEIRAAVDAMFAEKLASESGVERAAWAAQAMTNFAETWGFGAGLGASKASGWATAVLGQSGLPGAALALGFLAAALLPATADRPARAAAVVTLFGALLSEARIDLGLVFFLAAGAAVAGRLPVAAARRGAPETPAASAPPTVRRPAHA